MCACVSARARACVHLLVSSFLQSRQTSFFQPEIKLFPSVVHFLISPVLELNDRMTESSAIDISRVRSPVGAAEEPFCAEFDIRSRSNSVLLQ